MNVATNKMVETNLASEGERPIVIIGTGPVGVRVAQNLLRENPEQHLVIYGNEPWQPYNRVQLSSFLAGEVDWLGLTDSQRLPEKPNVQQRHHCEVVYIDTDKRLIVDQLERVQPYDRLVIATGSTPHVPAILGIEKQHVYRFRSLSDVQQLLARQVRSRRTVVLGGGVLGLEAARAMQRQHTEVVVIDHAHHLMNQQLDEAAAELLREHILSIGIKVQLGQGISELVGTDSVTGVRLRNGKLIECDTVIIATGIRSNIELARNARLSVGRGIRVDDRMQTSNPYIYAVGECAEHRHIVYGLVGPGIEQAGVVVQSLLNRPSAYGGSISATKLKVVGLSAFSMGEANIHSDPGQFFREYIYQHPAKKIYRKLIVKNGCLVGGIAIGQWDDLGRIQEAICKQRRIWPWQVRRFIHTGHVWQEQQTAQVGQWPATTVVCQCMKVNRGQLSKAISAGHDTVVALRQATGASGVCGGCQPLLLNLLGSRQKADKIGAFAAIFVLSLLAVLFAGLITILAPIPFQDSVMLDIRWDTLWRDKLVKQVSGYSILGLSLLAAILSLRKRIKSIRWFDFSLWRLVHVIAGVLIVTGLVSHSGFRLGENFNLFLMLDFLALLLLGSVAGVVMAMQHRLDAVRAVNVKNVLLWGHIMLLWPLPVLLGFHIIQTYYF